MKNQLAVAAAALCISGCAISPPQPALVTPKTIPDALQAYKRAVAGRIVEASAATYSEPLPEVMKSIVVLEITVDPLGRALEVSVLRTNGYADLAERAIASVAKAAPFAPPAAALLQGAPSFSFLETFLFRDDDFFQVRSLVEDAWKSSTTSPPASTD